MIGQTWRENEFQAISGRDFYDNLRKSEIPSSPLGPLQDKVGEFYIFVSRKACRFRCGMLDGVSKRILLRNELKQSTGKRLIQRGMNYHNCNIVRGTIC